MRLPVVVKRSRAARTKLQEPGNRETPASAVTKLPAVAKSRRAGRMKLQVPKAKIRAAPKAVAAPKLLAVVKSFRVARRKLREREKGTPANAKTKLPLAAK
jgi:hypothetical protein